MAEGEGKEKQERQKGAEEKHKKVLENDAESQDSVERHHHFARSVTVFQVAIALSAIAALTKRKAVWWVSLAVGAVGVFFLTQGFLPAH